MLKSWIACAVLYALSGNHTCPACICVSGTDSAAGSASVLVDDAILSDDHADGDAAAAAADDDSLRPVGERLGERAVVEQPAFHAPSVSAPPVSSRRRS